MVASTIHKELCQVILSEPEQVETQLELDVRPATGSSRIGAGNNGYWFIEQVFKLRCKISREISLFSCKLWRMQRSSRDCVKLELDCTVNCTDIENLRTV